MASESVAPWAESALLTAHDLAALSDRSIHYELVEGRLFRLSPIGVDHALACTDLATVLSTFATAHALGWILSGEPGFLISQPGQPDTVLAPDIAFIATDRLPPKSDRQRIGFPRLAPDLAVEIASPSQHRPELAAKARLWLDAGVRLVWIVWPESRQVDIWEQGSVTVRTLQAADRLDGGDVLPGFDYSLIQLWR